MIELQNISKAYGEAVVLDSLSAKLDSGKIIALVGRNGAGKSTLLRCIAMIDKADSGIIETAFNRFEFPLDPEYIIKDYWPSVTMVFQQFHLWPHLTVEQNLLLPLTNRFPKSYKEKLLSTTSRFYLSDLLYKKAEDLSVGQKQTVAIARAISLEPKILLLDEITSALDIINANKIYSILREEKEKGVTILLVTHSINYAIKTADEYMVLDQGKILEHNSISQIINPKSAFLKECLTDKGYLL